MYSAEQPGIETGSCFSTFPTPAVWLQTSSPPPLICTIVRACDPGIREREVGSEKQRRRPGMAEGKRKRRKRARILRREQQRRCAAVVSAVARQQRSIPAQWRRATQVHTTAPEISRASRGTGGDGGDGGDDGLEDGGAGDVGRFSREDGGDSWAAGVASVSGAETNRGGDDLRLRAISRAREISTLCIYVHI